MYCKHFMAFFGDIMKICIIGSSKRHKILAENLINKGFTVRLFSRSEEIENLHDFDCIILPIPTLKGDGKLNIDGSFDTNIDDLLNKVSKETIIITCNYQNDQLNTIDINKRDDFAFLNAIPTAEGSIKLAIEHSERCLFESNILITGFGRVAKVLADRLGGMRGSVTIAARSQKDKSYAETLGFNVYDYKKLKEKIDTFDIIFQTVPSLVLDKCLLEKVKNDTIIIELSSKSKGTDYCFADKKGIKVVHAPALPEKTAPISAGNILTRTVLEIIKEQSI
ncbi:MAG: hypothetical protein E7540_02175 [Ruminococcaceae bacterium]|nr:hypothetical protein [Oscillospiraceae bacterium]